MGKQFFKISISIFYLSTGCNDDPNLVEELKEPEPNNLVMKTISKNNSGSKVTSTYEYDADDKIDNYNIEIQNSISQYTIEYDYIYNSEVLSKIEERLVESSSESTYSIDRDWLFNYSNNRLRSIEQKFILPEENQNYSSFFEISYNEDNTVEKIIYSSKGLYFGKDVTTYFHYLNGNVMKVEGFVDDELRIKTEFTYGATLNSVNTTFTGFNYSAFSKNAHYSSKETQINSALSDHPDWTTVHHKYVLEEVFDDFGRVEIKTSVYKITNYQDIETTNADTTQLNFYY